MDSAAVHHRVKNLFFQAIQRAFVGDQLRGIGFMLRQTGRRAEALHLNDDVLVLYQLKQLVDRGAGLHRADELFFRMSGRFGTRRVQYRLSHLYLETFEG